MLRSTPQQLTPFARYGRAQGAPRGLDWSERRDHLAGQFAASLPGHFIERRWLATSGAAAHGNRALQLTPLGRTELLPRLDPPDLPQRLVTP